MRRPFVRHEDRFVMPEPSSSVRVLRTDSEVAEAATQAADFERRTGASAGRRLARYEELAAAARGLPPAANPAAAVSGDTEPSQAGDRRAAPEERDPRIASIARRARSA
jgi:hypothetical protein